MEKLNKNELMTCTGGVTVTSVLRFISSMIYIVSSIRRVVRR